MESHLQGQGHGGGSYDPVGLEAAGRSLQDPSPHPTRHTPDPGSTCQVPAGRRPLPSPSPLL